MFIETHRVVIVKKKCLLVAELGINHNGDFNLLKKLTVSAFENGADFVKLQLRTPRVCVPKSEWNKPREWFDGTVVSYIEYKEKIELTEEQLFLYDKFVTENFGKQKWFASVWDMPSLERLTKFDVPYIKIPSALITNIELVQACIDTNTPIVVSTGMSTEEEISRCIKLFPSEYDLTILSCTSSYPCVDEEVNLRKIEALWNMFNEYPKIYIDTDNSWTWDAAVLERKYGFSSHSKSPFIPIAANTRYDLNMIEVHFTLDRAMKGTDHAASLEPAGLALVARELKRLPIIIGDGQIAVYPSEELARKKLRGY